MTEPQQTETECDNALDDRTRELIAIGASVAAHCQPCLTFHVNRAAGLCISEEDIEAAVDVGEAVSEGATAAIKRHTKKALTQRERPACCTQGETAKEPGEEAQTGCCG